MDEFTSGDLAAICAHGNISFVVAWEYSSHCRDKVIDIKTVQYLYYCGFDMTQAVFTAICTESCDILEWLLSVCIVLPPDALDFVCVVGSMPMFNMLIQRTDVFINGRFLYDDYFDREYRFIPVLSAARYGHSDIILQLYNHGANMTVVDNKDRNALHHSCKANKLEATATLLGLGIPVIQDYKQRFPYELTTNKEIRALFGVE